LFDLLKKKLGSFAEKVKKKAERKEPAFQEKPDKTMEEPVRKEKRTQPEKRPEAAAEPREKPKKPVFEGPATPKKEEGPASEEKAENFGEQETKALEEEPAVEEGAEIPEKQEMEALEEGPVFEQEAVEPEPKAPSAEEERRELKPSISVRGKIRAAITGSVQLQESDLKDLLWELELALLEADVEQSTAEEICREIKERFLGKKISKKEGIEETVKNAISEILLSMMETEECDILKEIREKKEKPYKILFLGPNGAGKTTSIAKLTKMLQEKGLKAIWAAGDTFRAASIEQLEKHAENLGVRVVKHQYGSDPAAVAFDAVKAAQSRKIDVVLIDSAGRQETNRNLMGELEKIVRVVKPDLKIYVGEAFTGQALLQQAMEYNKAVGLDGFILSKIDCDSKGGTTISLLYRLKKPILFVGTGQEYSDLEKFEPGFVLSRVIG
jgi:fused signal recognition particle receptor